MVYFSLQLLSPLTVQLQKWIVSLVEHSFVAQGRELILLALLTAIVFTAYQFRSRIALPLNGLIEQHARYYAEKSIYRAIQRIPLLDLDQQQTKAKIDRMRGTARGLQGSVLTLAGNISDYINLIILFFMSLSYGWYYFFLFIAISIISVVFEFRYGEEKTAMNRDLQQKTQKMDRYFDLMTNRNSSAEIRLFGIGDWVREKWQTIYHQVINQRLHFEKQFMLPRFIAHTVNTLLYTGVLAFISLSVLQRKMDLAGYMLLTGSYANISRIVGNIVNSYLYAYEKGSNSREMRHFIENTVLSDEEPKDLSLDLGPLPPTLKFDHVSFSYHPDIPVLQDISFELGTNETVALVGSNGAGKSTFIKLALGLLPPDSGTITFGGKPIKWTERPCNKRAFSAVFQDYCRFELTIRENVGIGELSKLYDDSVICQAIRMGGAEEVLQRCNNDLDTTLGRAYDAGGTDLSGGEWQRLAISRGFMGEPSIIFFDEPASALDPLEEIRQFTQLKKFLTGRSGILVTHRIGLARLANRILFLKDGSILENGTHEELMNQKGAYYHLFTEQAKWYEEARE